MRKDASALKKLTAFRTAAANESGSTGRAANGESQVVARRTHTLQCTRPCTPLELLVLLGPFKWRKFKLEIPVRFPFFRSAALKVDDRVRGLRGKSVVIRLFHQ